MSGMAVKATKSMKKKTEKSVSRIKPTPSLADDVEELPTDLFDGFDDRSFSKSVLSQLTTSSISSLREKEDSYEEERESDEEEEEEDEKSEKEEKEAYRCSGGDKDPDDEGSGSSSESSKSTIKLPKIKKGKQESSKKYAEPEGENLMASLFGEEYYKRFAAESNVSRDRFLRIDGSYRGEVPDSEKWRIESIKDLLKVMVSGVRTFSKTEEIASVFRSMKASVDAIRLQEYKVKQSDIAMLGNEPGRSATKFLQDAHTCELLGTGTVHAVLNIEFPISHFMALYRKAAQVLSEKLDDLKRKRFKYGVRDVSTMNDIGREPTYMDVEQECRAKFHQVEANLASKYRGYRDEAIISKKSQDHRLLLESAYETAKEKIASGFVTGVQEEYASRIEAYHTVKTELLNKQAEMQKLENEISMTGRVIFLFEQLMAFFQHVWGKLKQGMGTQEVYLVVQGVLNKKWKPAGCSDYEQTPFNKGNMMGIWKNCQQYYCKLSIASYLNYEERRLQVLASKKIPPMEKQSLLAVLQVEKEELNYGDMPKDLFDVAAIVFNLHGDEKRDALRHLLNLTADIRDKSPKEIGPYIESLNIKESMDRFLEDMHMHVYSHSPVKRGQIGQGNFGAGETEEDGSDGEGYVGTKPEKKSSKKGQGKSSEKEKKGNGGAKDYYKSMPATAGWQQVGNTKQYTTCKDTLPLPDSTEILPGNDIYNCSDKNYDQSIRFTSTTNACEKCSKARRGEGKAHVPPCFTAKCEVCDRYGHTKRFCLHKF
jgi:hypothetical protein